MASPLAVPGIGRARFEGHTTSGGRTRMMMTEKRESGMALEKRDIPPESVNADTYVIQLLELRHLVEESR